MWAAGCWRDPSETPQDAGQWLTQEMMNCRAYWLLEYTLSRSRGMKATRSNLLLSVTMSYKAEVKSWLWGHCGPGSPPTQAQAVLSLAHRR